METRAFENQLQSIFLNSKHNEPLASHTTLGVGGPARWFVTATSTEQLQSGIQLAHDGNIPVFVLGWGSNLIVSDEGFPGLVIQNRAKNWKVIAAPASAPAYAATALARLEALGEQYYRVDDLLYSEEHEPIAIVQVESGAKIEPLMKDLLRQGITGLQWFAGIPASVGGAVYMNLHGGYHFFGDLVGRTLLFDPRASQNKLKSVDHDYFQFEYDRSVLHRTKETVLCVELKLHYGDVGRARAAAVEWARRKALQPQKSAGCIFRNLSAEEQKRLQLPTPSIGYLVEHVLKLKGERRGDAIISLRHAAFIENLGQASAEEVKELIALMKNKARDELGLKLIEEVEYI
ncbi:MAG: UDP-N-acetylmuramate dehydrogenase [bacterium]